MGSYGGHDPRNCALLVNSPKSEKTFSANLRHYEGQETNCPAFMQPYYHGLKPESVLKIDLYKSGSIVNWPIDGPTAGRKMELPDRAASLEQSSKSRLNAAWKIGNASTEWFAMTTLTYPPGQWDFLTAESITEDRNKFFASVRSKYPKQDRAWILEFTKKGIPHFHIFWGLGPLTDAIKKQPKKTVRRKGHEGNEVKNVEIARGDVDGDIIRWWSKRADDGSEKFTKFQHGGITEILRCPEGAAAYVAKEAGKRCQKIAPWEVSAWWGMTNDIKPIHEETIEITVEEYIYRYGNAMMSKLWDKPID